ncbi:selenocysteine-specific translation elongation factor [Asanoa sp. WMMD1127]|uniref:selenocysteine-specific translation elongation factor n=1 Tax=Asanoa sp. WMMD1127 TaxID=3016107 RepID=UPI0024169600|nr:selenocysteine-specific translation elongation factor [Asanoa sp. WMMD1127]MDG4826561.1 selenocysteine-specific translation elongation factor [Asanoa sp. WMMD1127]
MHVVATAGHVDHGKSTLVRALTGMEPDRWAEERRRGMTIDLGYAWTDLPSGATLAFVDVPGHERFVPNMLAGVGPVPAAMLVVGADEGWMPQSAEHLAALDALGVTHGLLVVTRADLADPGPATRRALDEIAATSLGAVEAVAVSGATGAGLADLRSALDRLVAGLPPADPAAPVRLWVDRAFTIQGSGTVVTGTLGAGTLRAGDELALGDRRVRVKGLQSLGRPAASVEAVARVAVNLRHVPKDAVGRGDALLTPGAFRLTELVDVRVHGDPTSDLPATLVLHVGSAAVAVGVRPLGKDTARLRLRTPLPLRIGDRALLRDPGRHHVAGGVTVLDPLPPPLRRRGAAAARATELTTMDGHPDAADELRRRGLMTGAQLRMLGAAPPAGGERGVGGAAPSAGRAVGERGMAGAAPSGGGTTGERGAATSRGGTGGDPGMPGAASAGAQPVAGDWFADPALWARLREGLVEAVDRHAAAHPLEPGMPVEALRRALGLPDRALVEALVTPPLIARDGRVSRPGGPQVPAAIQQALDHLDGDLRERPFHAPDADRLRTLGLGPRELAAAVRAGALVKIADGIVLPPASVDRAVEVLRQIPQPFTLSQARQALDTTRRVAVPLLELLDRRGATTREPDDRRRVG